MITNYKNFMYTIYLNLNSFDLNCLNQTENYLYSIFSFFKIRKIKHKMISTPSKKITVLRSPHIDKKSREQFQMVTHKRTLVLNLNDKHLVLILLNLLKSIKLPGVELELLLEFFTFLPSSLHYK
uniref:Ribosomal protein S10 n=1 Tax=Micractinium conductrix TaxID=554055 RepID=A0A2I4S778_9CHLO|nr:ribosomal protein S10 [Micractinium conductrix]